MEGTVEELKSITDRLIDATRPLAESFPKIKGKPFLGIMAVIYRKNFFTLSSIRYLAEKPEFGDKALDLARSMIEDVVSVEYMLANGKDNLARKFRRFLWVQLHQESEFMKTLGNDPGKLGIDMDEVNKEYLKVKKEFTHKPSNTDLHSWLGMDVDKILESLEVNIKSDKEFKMTQHDIDVTSIGYVYGNRKNHLNPYDVFSFLDEDNHKISRETDRRQALVFSSTCIIRLTTRYIDEIRSATKKDDFEDVARKVKEVFAEMDS